jgi:hypothetical protein
MPKYVEEERWRWYSQTTTYLEATMYRRTYLSYSSTRILATKLIKRCTNSSCKSYHLTFNRTEAYILLISKLYVSILHIYIWYIYLLQLGFHPVAVVGNFVQKQETDSYIQKKKQYTKQYENKEYTK